MVDPVTGLMREIAPGEMDDPIFATGGSTFKSTALDYARFCRMLLNRGELGGVRVLKPESVDLMLSNLLSEARSSRPSAVSFSTSWATATVTP